MSLCGLFWIMAFSSVSALLPPPTLQVKLIIKGEIQEVNKGGYALLDQTFFDSLTRHTLQKKDDQNESEEKKYGGYRLRDILERVGCSGTKIEVVSKNGESFSIDYTTFKKLNPILITHINDTPIQASEAPFSLIFEKEEKNAKNTSVNMLKGVYKIVVS